MAFIRWFIGKIILFFDAVFAPAAPQRSLAAQKELEERAKHLSIYEFKACPFCVKVRRFLKSEGIRVQLKDAKTEPYRSELVAGGGKPQVPCLRIEKGDGTVSWLYESNDIISYLRETLLQGSTQK